MKIGDKVKILKSFSGPCGSYAGSPPFKDETALITSANINAMEDMLRAGYVEMYVESQTVVKQYLKPNETPDILPHPKIGGRGRQRHLQPKDDKGV